ncbi:MAG: hypothetical protein WDO14_05785 [Bacteroidota bacterium]
MYTKRGWWVVKFVVFGVLMVVLLGLLTQFLWNFIMPDIFGLPMINFWQGLAMFALAKLIFGFGGKGHNKWGGYRNHRWRKEWVEKYSKLSPDERERLKQKFKDKWCSWEENSVKQPETQKDPQ